MKEYCLKSNTKFISTKYPYYPKFKFSYLLNLLLLGILKVQIMTLFKRIKPSLVIQTNDAHDFNNIVVTVAKDLHIPSLAIQWAQTAPELYYIKLKTQNRSGHNRNKFIKYTTPLINLIYRFHVIFSKIPLIKKKSLGQGFSDYIFVINQYTKLLLKKQGVNESKIYIAGSIAYDDALSSSFRPDIEIKTQLQIDDDKITILYISQPFYKKDIRILSKSKQLKLVHKILENVIKFYNSIKKDFNFIIKLHPIESEEDYLHLTKDFKSLKIIKDFNNAELIKISDFCIGYSSTLLQSVIIMKKPVLSLNLIPELKSVIEIGSQISGIAHNIQSWSEFQENLQALEINGYQPLDNVNRKNFVLDKKVYFRMETWISELITHNQILSNHLEPS